MSNDNPERAKAELVNYLEGRVEAGHTSGSPILRAALEYARSLPVTDPRFAELPAGGFDALGVYQWLKTGGSRNWSAPASPEDGQKWLDDYFVWRLETGDNLPNPEDLI